MGLGLDRGGAYRRGGSGGGLRLNGLPFWWWVVLM